MSLKMMIKYHFWKYIWASERFVCIRDMYQNVDTNHCQNVTKEDLRSDAIEQNLIYEPIDKLYIDSNIQYVKTSWWD